MSVSELQGRSATAGRTSSLTWDDAPDGFVERFRSGFMPNSTVPYLRSMTPADVDGTATEVYAIDEYVHTDLRYLDLLRPPTGGGRTLLALVGVQSHQFHRTR